MSPVVAIIERPEGFSMIPSPAARTAGFLCSQGATDPGFSAQGPSRVLSTVRPKGLPRDPVAVRPGEKQNRPSHVVGGAEASDRDLIGDLGALFGRKGAQHARIHRPRGDGVDRYPRSGHFFGQGPGEGDEPALGAPPVSPQIEAMLMIRPYPRRIMAGRAARQVA